MAYSSDARDFYQKELSGIREGGLFKEERYIHSPQGVDVEVEFPSGNPPKASAACTSKPSCAATWASSPSSCPC